MISSKNRRDHPIARIPRLKDTPGHLSKLPQMPSPSAAPYANHPPEMKFSAALCRRAAALLFLLLAAGCETIPLEPSENFKGDMVVVTDYASFYRLGPQQAGGADRSLRTGDRVMLLRKQFGYSRVQLDDNQVGYMANEDIQAAPPEPRRRFSRAEEQARSSGRGSRAPRVYEDDLYGDFDILDPNLDLLPDDLPLEPLPELFPDPVDLPTPAPTPPPTPVREGLPEIKPETPPPVSTST